MGFDSKVVALQVHRIGCVWKTPIPNFAVVSINMSHAQNKAHII